MTPKLSIITACYNHGQFVEQSMRSVLTQTEPDIELIVVNDASTDNSWDVISGIAETDLRVRTIFNPTNCGLAASQNLGIARARSPWVLKVDADDYISPTYIAEILAAAEQDERRNVIFSPAHEFGARDRVYYYPRFDPNRMIDYLMIPGPAAFTVDLWDAVGGYDESLRSAEDWDLYIRAQLAVGLEPFQLPNALWHYRQHTGPRASAIGMSKLPSLQAYWRGHTRESVLSRSRTWADWCQAHSVAA